MLLELIVAVGATGVAGYFYFRRILQSKQISWDEELHEEIVATERIGKEKAAKSLLRSKQVRIGLSEENMVIYHQDFPYDGGDFRAMGSPIDGMIFAGSVQGDITEIVFLEVKTGNSRLSKKQRQIKNLVKKGKVKWLEFRIDTKPVVLKHKENLAEIDECLCADCIE